MKELPGWVSSLVNLSCQQREVELGKSSVRNSSSPCLTCVFHSVSPADWLIDWLIICCLDSAHKTPQTVYLSETLTRWPLLTSQTSGLKSDGRIFTVYSHFWQSFPMWMDNEVTTDCSLANCYVMDLGRGGGWGREREGERGREAGRERLLHSLSTLLFLCQLQHACFCCVVASCVDACRTLICSICFSSRNSFSVAPRGRRYAQMLFCPFLFTWQKVLAKPEIWRRM